MHSFGVRSVHRTAAMGAFEPKVVHSRWLTGWVGRRAILPQARVVAPRPRVPAALRRGPFSLEEARAAGITLTALRGKSWRRLGRELYCWAALHEDHWKLLAAWQRRLPRDSAFAGSTAGWLHGIDLDPIHPIEVVVPSRSAVRSRPGLSVRRSDISTRHLVKVRGLRATTVHSTLSDLCRRLPEVEALIAIDAALHLRLISKAALRREGVRRFRSLAAHAEPAESPMETRLRWVLLQARLPPPHVQSDLHDSHGQFVGRADLYYPAARLVIEYDGGTHRDRLVEDNRRQNLLIDAGFMLLRFTAGDVHNRPETVEALVRRALTPAPNLVSGTGRPAAGGSA